MREKELLIELLEERLMNVINDKFKAFKYMGDRCSNPFICIGEYNLIDHGIGVMKDKNYSEKEYFEYSESLVKIMYDYE